MKILHIGCGPFKYPEYINTDIEMDISKKWPYEDSSIDGIVAQHVFQELGWKDLLFTFQEAYRVLKLGSIMRFGVPLVDSSRSLALLLQWGNKNLFTEQLLYIVLLNLGFKTFKKKAYQETQSKLPLTLADNRPEETTFIEVKK